MKTYLLSILKTFKKNFLRFLSLVLIILVGICFVTGVGGITPKVENSFEDYYSQYNVVDLIIKSKATTGFSDDDLDKVKADSQVKDAISLTSIDTTISDEESRIYVYDFDSSINKLELLEGSLPDEADEIAVEESSATIKKRALGDTVSYMGMDFEVTGIVKNPLMYSKDGDASITNTDESLSLVMYLNADKNVLPLPKTDIFVDLKNPDSYKYFTQDYLDYVDKEKDSLKKLSGFSSEDVSYLGLSENKSYEILKNLGEKVNVIAAIFPAFFIVVVALVVLTTMTRMIDEERSLIGCYSSLGYSKAKIRFKYLTFGLISSLIGIASGITTGIYLLPNLIYPAFGNVLILPTITKTVSYLTGLISSIGMLAATLTVTLLVTNKSLKETPASLLLPLAPKPGKKILLERIPFIWKHLKFKYKSAIRNIFRYQGRLWMVIISVLGSSALVMAGLGIYDVSGAVLDIDGIKVNLTSTLQPIALIVIFFAMALSVLVLFNLTNMNIGERQKEIATLKVLGYKTLEVDSYVFREIFAMSLMGIILGIPTGLGLLYFIFKYLDFGSIADIKWSSYLLAFVISLSFIGIVDLLLSRKIHKIDMNDSLKSVE
jgi:putative ABC transport system permease protein